MANAKYRGYYVNLNVHLCVDIHCTWMIDVVIESHQTALTMMHTKRYTAS